MNSKYCTVDSGTSARRRGLSDSPASHGRATDAPCRHGTCPLPVGFCLDSAMAPTRVAVASQWSERGWRGRCTGMIRVEYPFGQRSVVDAIRRASRLYFGNLVGGCWEGKGKRQRCDWQDMKAASILFVGTFIAEDILNYVLNYRGLAGFFLHFPASFAAKTKGRGGKSWGIFRLQHFGFSLGGNFRLID